MHVSLELTRPVGSPGGLDVLSFRDPASGWSATCTASAGTLRGMVPESVADFDAILSADGAMGPAWVAAKAQAATLGLTLDQLAEATKRAAMGN